MNQPAAARGRPRDTSIDDRVLDIATALLYEHGYEGLSMEDVAERAGTAKTTVYRRWPSKARLVVAVLARAQDAIPIPSAGTVHHDLTALVEGVRAGLTQPGMRQLAAGLASAAANDPELAQVTRALWSVRREATMQRIQAAIDDGELSGSADPALIVDQLAGPLYYRLLITGDRLDPELAPALVTSALAGVTPSKGTAS